MRVVLRPVGEAAKWPLVPAGRRPGWPHPEVLGLNQPASLRGQADHHPGRVESRCRGAGRVVIAASARAVAGAARTSPAEPNWVDIHGVTRGGGREAQLHGEDRLRCRRICWCATRCNRRIRWSTAPRKWTILFKGGNLLDIQLATDPDADAKRDKPGPRRPARADFPARRQADRRGLSPESGRVHRRPARSSPRPPARNPSIKSKLGTTSNSTMRKQRPASMPWPPAAGAPGPHTETRHHGEDGCRLHLRQRHRQCHRDPRLLEQPQLLLRRHPGRAQRVPPGTERMGERDRGITPLGARSS